MKRILLSLSVAAMGLALASCQVSEVEPQAPEEVAEFHTVTFTSAFEETKTTMTEGSEYAEFSWGAEDASRFRVFENGVAATSTTVSINDDIATVTAKFSNKRASSYTYTAYVNGSSSLVVPDAQTYSAGAYDENADLLVADPITESTAPQSLLFTFRRATSTVKMTLKGLASGEVVSKVVVTSAESDLAGTYNKTSGEFEDGSKTLTLTGSVTADASGAAPIYFMCTPATAATLTLEVTTDKGVYEKTLGKALEFPQRTVVRFGVGLSGCKKEDSTYYEKVTAAPQDWSGTYLIVFEGNDDAPAVAFNGALSTLDAVSNGVSVSIENDRIESSEAVDAAVFTIAAVSGGYSVKSASGYYIGRSAESNGLETSTSEAYVNTIDFDSDNYVFITGTSGRCLRYNSYTNSNGLRFRYYTRTTTNANSIYLYKKVQGSSSGGSSGGSTDPVENAVTVTINDASEITSGGATISASFSGATAGTIREVGFQWGTTAMNLGEDIYVDQTFTSTSGSFSGSMPSLSASTTYYYRAYVLTTGLKYYYSDIKSFTTKSTGGGGTSDATAYAKSWLSNYEIPSTDVALSSGNYYHGRVTETYGSTYAYYYTPTAKSTTQRIVTHTFNNTAVSPNKVMRNYTLLYDYDLHAALWCAFAMNADAYPKKVTRDDAFVIDPAIPSSVQPNSTYSGYDRGHQVASADRLTTREQNHQTFYYSNMTPQLANLNQQTWVSEMENKVQTVGNAITGRDTLYVVTGCIFENTKTTTTAGSMTVPVPTKYYKCLMKCTFNTSGTMTAASGAGYIFEHEGYASRQDVTIDYVEQLTGFDFFANVPASLQNAAEASSYSFF